MDGPVPEARAWVEESELDENGDPDRFGSQPLHQATRGEGGAAGGEDVIDDQHSGTAAEGVAVYLESIGAVFQAVVRGFGRPGELSRLPDRDQTGFEPVRDRSAWPPPAPSEVDRPPACGTMG